MVIPTIITIIINCATLDEVVEPLFFLNGEYKGTCIFFIQYFLFKDI